MRKSASMSLIGWERSSPTCNVFPPPWLPPRRLLESPGSSTRKGVCSLPLIPYSTQSWVFPTLVHLSNAGQDLVPSNPPRSSPWTCTMLLDMTSWLHSEACIWNDANCDELERESP